jgi:predicted NBD/HSP70 family sugar kinase
LSVFVFFNYLIIYFRDIKVNNPKKHITGSFKLMNEVNTTLVLDAVRISGGMSRADLSRKTNILPATVGNVIAELIDKGLVVETNIENKEQIAGRPGKIVKLNDTSRLVLAVDIEPERLRLAVSGLNLNIVGYSEFPIDRFTVSKEIIRKIKIEATNLLSINSDWQRRLIGIGVSLPGFIDSENGIGLSSTNMPLWKDVPVRLSLTEAFNKPVRIGRSMHLAALTEKWRRPEIRDKNVLFIVLRTGIGVSLLIKGQLYYGASSLDGEIGHTVIDPGGKMCECGKKGCLETFISSSAIKERCIEVIKSGKAQALYNSVDGNMDNITTELLYELANQGDKDCESIVREIVKYLGMAAANLIQTLNPHELVVCGKIDVAEKILFDELNKVFKEMVMEKMLSNFKIYLSPYKERAALYGAAALILEEFFALPDLTFPSSLIGKEID